MKSDIDIAQAAKLEKITSIAKKLDIPENSLEPYGHYKAKISLDFLKSLENKEDGVVIQIEEDYEYGTRVPLYSPPKVDSNIIVEGVLNVLEMGKVESREDLRISNVAEKYANLFV